MFNFVVVLTLCIAATDAQARASGIAPGRWSGLSAEQMNRFPTAVRLALQSAQNLCGGETTRIRTGFLRYLPGPGGQEFTTIHFEHFECSSKDLLCSPDGCLHRIFVTTSGGMHREIWRGNIREIDMSNVSGIPSIDFDCGQGGSFCHFQRKWNGTRLQ
jgi:hypothetical protein